MVEVESHPFDIDTMLFMDWRDDHTATNPAMRESNRRASPSCVCQGIAFRYVQRM